MIIIHTHISVIQNKMAEGGIFNHFFQLYD